MTLDQLRDSIPEYARDSHGDLAAQTRRLNGSDRTLAAAAARPAPGDTAMRAGCMACHGVAKAAVGPAFNDVARRYRNDPGAAAQLALKVQQGGAGNWGTVPMPPQAVAAGDLHAIIGWILDRLQ